MGCLPVLPMILRWHGGVKRKLDDSALPWYRLSMAEMSAVDDTAAFTVRLPKEMHAWLRRYCFEQEISMASFVNQAVENEREKIERAAIRRR